MCLKKVLIKNLMSGLLITHSAMHSCRLIDYLTNRTVRLGEYSSKVVYFHDRQNRTCTRKLLFETSKNDKKYIIQKLQI